MTNKYPGVRQDDTFWDEHHRKNGMMTNREFFSSNGKGGFYEGMTWDEDEEEWVNDTPEPEIRECDSCGGDADYCWC